MLVTGLFAEFDIGQQTEDGPTPIRAAPGPSVLQPLIAGSWQALRHSVDHVAPDFRLVDKADPRPNDRLEVGRQALAQPAVRRAEVWKVCMKQLVGDHPIVTSGRFGHAIRSAHEQTWTAATEGDPARRFP